MALVSGPKTMTKANPRQFFKALVMGHGVKRA